MKNDFVINKSGKSLEELKERCTVPEAITSAERPILFRHNYFAPTFNIGADGRLQGGDMEAMETFFEKFASKEESMEEEAQQEPALDNSAAVAPEPCC